jgi:plastocyanin
MRTNRTFAAWRAPLLVCAGLLAWACSKTDFTGVPMAFTASVTMTDQLTFVPDTIVVPVNGTVTWRNNSTTWHTVTADTTLAQDSTSVQLPSGALPFNSDTIPPSKAFSHKFTVAGTYKYFSIPDETAGMVGWVVVQ